ncbi:MAG TPA: prepilin-type N-terminal cleavage/methylation domain-containing protein [Candidatus Saccharimonadales bacterium]|nr:prepilin-type N-terminal cleavage/methylation domain-containing protein [Candidatus Saccharimonadales bacterium]
MKAHAKSQSGFAIIEVIAVIVVLGIIGFVGWYVWQGRQTDKPAQQTAQSGNDSKNNQKSDEYKEGDITIKQASEIGAQKRQEMLAKVIHPFRDYTNKSGAPITSIVVTISTDPSGKPDQKYGYDLAYEQKGNSNSGQGFTFGENGTINYWIPSLCDDGGCQEYPAWFKAKYPATYQAFQEAQTGQKK